MIAVHDNLCDVRAPAATTLPDEFIAVIDEFTALFPVWLN